ncbi:MAG TPA: hypothetical protein VM598_14480 [Bdellovibrionota bacterium]|nr:hypothetical protein [Bdellovibrionota bacterium]
MRTFLMFLLLAPQLALAQGGSGVKGGDAVACFDRPVKWVAGSGHAPYEDLIAGQTLTETGRKHIRSADSREGYQIEHLGEKSAFWESLRDRFYDDALEAMIARFDEFPIFSLKLREFNALLRPYWKGMPSPAGLYDVADSGGGFTLIPECGFVQAVQRDRDFFTFDSTVNEFFEHLKPGPKAALMQLHEVMYFHAVNVLGHKTSAGVERLLIEALGRDHTAESLMNELVGRKFVANQYQIALFRTRKQLTDRIESEVAKAIAHFQDLSARVARGTAPCPDNERNPSGPGRQSPLHHPMSYRHVGAEWTDVLDGYFPGGDYAQPFPQILVKPTNELRQAVTDVNQKSWFTYEILDRSRQNCRYAGKPMTQEQLDRIVRAKEELLTFFR